MPLSWYSDRLPNLDDEGMPGSTNWFFCIPEQFRLNVIWLLLLTSLHGLLERQLGGMLKSGDASKLQLGTDQHTDQQDCESVCWNSVNASIPLFLPPNDTVGVSASDRDITALAVVTVCWTTSYCSDSRGYFEGNAWERRSHC